MSTIQLPPPASNPSSAARLWTGLHAAGRHELPPRKERGASSVGLACVDLAAGGAYESHLQPPARLGFFLPGRKQADLPPAPRNVHKENAALAFKVVTAQPERIGAHRNFEGPRQRSEQMAKLRHNRGWVALPILNFESIKQEKERLFELRRNSSGGLVLSAHDWTP